MKSIQDLRIELEQVQQNCNKMLENTPAASWTQKNEIEFNKEVSRGEGIKAEIAGLQKQMQGMADGTGSHDGGDIKMLRNSKDIRAHYGAMNSGARPGEEVRIDDFLRGVAGMKSNAAVHAALSTGTDTAGGFLLPKTVMPGILDALFPASALLTAGAGIVPLDEGAKSFTTAAIETIPTAAWRLESGAIAQSEPTFRAIEAQPKSLAFMFKVSRELLADSPNMAAALYTVIGQAFAKELDRVGFQGTGTNPEPRGLTTWPGVTKLAGNVITSYQGLLKAAAETMKYRAPMPTAAIMCPRDLVALASGVDGNGQPLQKPQMMADWQLLQSAEIPDHVGGNDTYSNIYVGDFTKMAFMMREQVSIQLAKELFAGTGEIGFICHVRADIAVMYPKAFAIFMGATLNVPQIWPGINP